MWIKASELPVPDENSSTVEEDNSEINELLVDSAAGSSTHSIESPSLGPPSSIPQYISVKNDQVSLYKNFIDKMQSSAFL